jgi:Tol biopolymer transport system component
LTGTTIRLNVLPNGNEVGSGNSTYDARLAISGDGRYVAFASAFDLATNGGDNNGFFLYLRDVQSGITRYVAGTPSTSPVGYVAMSDDGRWLAYTLNIVAPATATIGLHDIANNQNRDIFSFDQSQAPAGLRQGIGISANGRYIAFALNSAAITGSSADQVMVVDSEDPNAPILVSTGANGAGDGASAWPQISGDGRFVLFTTKAPNLTGGLALPWRDVLVARDLVGQSTAIASRRPDGTGTYLATQDFGHAAISIDGRTIAFVSEYSDVFGGAPWGAEVFTAPRP